MPRTLGPTWLAAESERIGAVDYNSVFTLQKKICLVQYPSLALTKVWKSCAPHTPEKISSSFHPCSSRCGANINSNYGRLRRPLKGAGFFFFFWGEGWLEKENDNNQLATLFK